MRRLLTVLAVVGVFAGALVACDSTEITPLGFDPFDTEDGVLSVYGYLETGTFDQTVRVQLLRRTIERPRRPEDAAVDALVTTEALSTGAVTIWTPRLVRFADSTYGEVYDATLEPRTGETYQLVVERGADRATAEVTVPPMPRATLVAPSAPRSQTVVWAPLTRITTTRFVARIGCGQGSIPVTVSDAITVVQEGDQARMILDLDVMRRQVDATLGTAPATTLFLAEFLLTLTVADAKWTLPADTTALVQPEINSNIEGGYGRFGAVTRGFFAWKPDAAALDGLAIEVCP
ncbi:MAG: DUF4249 family protein [Bacteroidota bacterium]